MSPIVLMLLAGLGATPTYDGGPSIQQLSVAPVRSAAELRTAVHEALRHWVHPADSVADRAACELLALYNEVLHQPNMAQESRQEVLLTLRGRLKNLAQQIAARNAKSRPVAAAGREPAFVPNPANQILAQVAPPESAPGMGGRPAGWGNPAAPQGNANDGPPDAGGDLVDVIQKTISPQSWDINGGPGSIMYWKSGNSLVVSQSAEVHESLADLIDQLRRAGH